MEQRSKNLTLGALGRPLQSGVANTRRNQALLLQSGERRSAPNLSRLTPNALFIMLFFHLKPYPKPAQIDAGAGLTEAIGAQTLAG